MNAIVYNSKVHLVPLVTDEFVKAQEVAYVVFLDSAYSTEIIHDQLVTLSGMRCTKNLRMSVGHILFAQQRGTAVFALFKTKFKEFELPAVASWIEKDLIFFDTEVVEQAMAVVGAASPELLAPHCRTLFNGLMKGQKSRSENNK